MINQKEAEELAAKYAAFMETFYHKANEGNAGVMKSLFDERLAMESRMIEILMNECGYIKNSDGFGFKEKELVTITDDRRLIII